jgi:hypothetical protein
MRTVETPEASSARRASLVQVDRALQSSRDSGFDLSTAVGEAIDNPIEASATIVRIRTYAVNTPSYNGIHRIAFADNGTGIETDVLPHVPSLGFSTRYNRRDGLGRFGMGLKLAALSQGRRMDIYTKAKDGDGVWHAYVDLDEVEAGTQLWIDANQVPDFPEDLAELMRDDSSGNVFTSGTLIVWSKVDRLHEGGKFGSSNATRLSDLTKFLARTYRRFLSHGIRIELNGKNITPHDPMFLLENPILKGRFEGENVVAEIIQEDSIEIDGSRVEWTVTLLPECFRRVLNQGGKATKERPQFAGLHIPDNDDKVSILRNGREIYYAVVPKLLPGGTDSGGIDRFIGVEIRFPATLDEHFQVRNVKRGAEPVEKLREELRKALKKPVETSRERIRELWRKTKQTEAAANTHDAAQNAVNRAEQTSPRGRGGMKTPKAVEDQKVEQIVADVVGDKNDPSEATKLRERIKSLPITIADGSWPGKELLDIEHLNGRATVKVNRRHPFIARIYGDVEHYISSGSSGIAQHAPDVLTLLERVVAGLDVLFMAYAKAENMHDDPIIAYGDLRSYLGQFAAAYTNELLKDI